MLLLATPIVRLVCPLHVLSFLRRSWRRGWDSNPRTARTVTGILGRPPGGLVRSMAERVGFEPTDRSHGHRDSRETARRARPKYGGEGGIRTHGPLARSKDSRETARRARPKCGGEGGIRTHGPLARSKDSRETARRARPKCGGEGGIRTHGPLARSKDSRETARRARPKCGGEGGIRTHGPLARSKDSRETARRARPKCGGEGGIRTHGPLARSTVFETAPFDHSGTSPRSSATRRVSSSPAPEWRRGWDSNPR